jgi:hypothetical protein
MGIRRISIRRSPHSDTVTVSSTNPAALTRTVNNPAVKRSSRY